MADQEIIVRRARPDDGPDLGVVHVVAWQIGYRGQLPAAYLDALDPEQRGQVWRDRLAQGQADGLTTMVAEVGRRVVGFSSHGAYRSAPDDPDDLCELWALYVHPERWGSGVAQALMAASVDGLRLSRSEPRAALWVLETNARGRCFYEKVGWAADGTTKIDEIGGAEVTELRYTIELPTESG